jgi:hypothetical protein
MPVLLVEVEILAVEAHAGRVLRERIDDHIERLCRRVARPLGVKPEGERERRLGGVRSWNTATSLATSFPGLASVVSGGVVSTVQMIG